MAILPWNVFCRLSEVVDMINLFYFYKSLSDDFLLGPDIFKEQWCQTISIP